MNLQLLQQKELESRRALDAATTEQAEALGTWLLPNCKPSDVRTFERLTQANESLTRARVAYSIATQAVARALVEAEAVERSWHETRDEEYA